MGENLPIGDCIARSFQLWIRNLIPFTVASAVLTLPLAPLNTRAVDETGNLNWPLLALVMPIGMLAGAFLTAFVTHSVVQQLRGLRPALGEVLRHTFARLPAVFLVAVLMILLLGLICGGIGLVMLLVIGALLGFGELIGLLLVVPAMLAMFLAMVMVMVMLCPAIPAAVSERCSASQAFQRGLALTRRQRLRVAAVLLVVLGLYGIMVTVSTFIAQIAGNTMEQQVLINTVLNLPINALVSVVPAVIYFHLRLARDGVDSEDLAGIFA